MSGHYRSRSDDYLGFSTRKVHIALWHETQLRDALAEINRVGGGFFEPSRPDDPWVVVEGHADGCVLQLFAAFDAFACAAAWRFRLAEDDDALDRWTFWSLADKPPSEIGDEVRRARDSAEFDRLRELRHAAGHRSLVVGAARLGASGVRLVTAESKHKVEPDNVVDILGMLRAWAEPTMVSLQTLALSQGWPSEYARPHLLVSYPDGYTATPDSSDDG